MIKNRALNLWALVFLGTMVIWAAGCGYTTHSMISGKWKTIYVTPFLNKVDLTQETYTASKYRIYRPMMETDITRAVVNRYLFDGNLKPVKEEQADLTLKGELIEYRKDPLRYVNNDEDAVLEYRVNIVINITLWDNKEKKIVWDEPGFTGDYTYFTQPQGVTPALSEDQAISNAITDLARRIIERTVEQW